jgi:hypothetical protein
MNIVERIVELLHFVETSSAVSRIYDDDVEGT